VHGGHAQMDTLPAHTQYSVLENQTHGTNLLESPDIVRQYLNDINDKILDLQVLIQKNT
jgi:hypothetical protein